MTSSIRRWAIVQLILLFSLPFVAQAVAANWAGSGLGHQPPEALPAVSPRMPDGPRQLGAAQALSHPNAVVTLHLPVVLNGYISGQVPTPVSLFSPTPTSTPTATPTPTNTATPTATHTPTPTPTLACATATQGCITILVYNDENANARRDPGELLLPGALITVTNMNDIEAPRVVATYTTDGRSEPHPFTLSEGSYTVQEENPAGFDSFTVVPSLANGGFEDGLVGWSTGGVAANADVYAFTFDLWPTEGSLMAQLDASADEPHTSGDIDGNGVDDYNDTRLSQSFTLDASQVPATLSFDWAFFSSDPLNDDFFRVTLDGVPILAGSENEATGSTYSDAIEGQWQSFSTLVATPGTHTLEFLVANQSDEFYEPILLLDNVQLLVSWVDHWDVSIVANQVVNLEFRDYLNVPEVVALSHAETADYSSTALSSDQTGQLCVWAFDDRDEDGIKDPWDPIVPGSKISVWDPGPPPDEVDSTVTEHGDIGPRCFTLAPGMYHVVEVEPPGYISTTPNLRGAVVTAGKRTDVIFANRRHPRQIVVIESILRQGTRDEVIVIVNRGETAQDLSGWRIRSYPEDYSHWFTFPGGYALDAGARVRIHSGREAEDHENPPSDLFWTDRPVWDDEGDVAFLYDRDGYIVDIECYGNTCTQETPTPLPTHTAIWPTHTPTSSPTETPVGARTATPTASPTPTPVPDAAVIITDLQPLDRNEVVVLVNNWTGPLDLNHWSLVSLEGGEAFDFDFPVPFVLQPGQEVRIHSGPDAFSKPPEDLFWTVVPIWDDSGDTAVLYDPAGNQIDSLCYGGILDCRLGINEIQYENSNEYIEIVNRTAFAQDLTNWRIESVTGEEWYWFPEGFTLDKRGSRSDTVRIHSGPNAYANPPTDLVWGDGSNAPAGQPVWNDLGDSGVLYDAQGVIVDVFCYGVAECFTPTPEPTATASLTPTPRSTPPPQRTLTPEEVVIETIRYSTTDEFITLKNVGSQTVVLVDWEIRSVRGDEWYRFPEPILLHPDKTVRIHSGPHAHVDPPTDLLWYDGSDEIPGTLIWNDLADAAVLYGRVRDIKDVYCYGYDSCDVVIADVSGCRLDESIAIWNQAIVHRNLTGWQIWSLTGGEIFNFPDSYILPPGGVVLVHSGPEAFCDPPSDILWHNPQWCPFDPRLRAGPEIWDDVQQDRAVLVDNNGILVSTFLHLGCQGQ